MTSPSMSERFDRAYRLPITIWGDVRIPDEVKALVKPGQPQRALEVGCGVGRLSRFLALQGVRVTGVDFSGVAIDKARQRVAQDKLQPDFVVGDVTRLA